jgi:hypothetical protein
MAGYDQNRTISLAHSDKTRFHFRLHVWVHAATNWLCFACRTTRTTLARLIRYFLATSVKDIPARRSRTRAMRSTLRGARPSLFPSRRALRMPALTRSTIKDRSNSAIEPTIVRNIRPIGPLLSMHSRAERNVTSTLVNSSMISRKFFVLRAIGIYLFLLGSYEAALAANGFSNPKAHGHDFFPRAQYLGFRKNQEFG